MSAEISVESYFTPQVVLHFPTGEQVYIITLGYMITLVPSDDKSGAAASRAGIGSAISLHGSGKHILNFFILFVASSMDHMYRGLFFLFFFFLIKVLEQLASRSYRPGLELERKRSGGGAKGIPGLSCCERITNKSSPAQPPPHSASFVIAAYALRTYVYRYRSRRHALEETQEN